MCLGTVCLALSTAKSRVTYNSNCAWTHPLLDRAVTLLPPCRHGVCVCVCAVGLKSWESWILDEMRLVWPLKQSRLLALKITSWTSSFQKCPCWQRDVNSTACSGCKLSSAFQGLCFSYNVGTVLFNERGWLLLCVAQHWHSTWLMLL